MGHDLVVSEGVQSQISSKSDHRKGVFTLLRSGLKKFQPFPHIYYCTLYIVCVYTCWENIDIRHGEYCPIRHHEALLTHHGTPCMRQTSVLSLTNEGPQHKPMGHYRFRSRWVLIILSYSRSSMFRLHTNPSKPACTSFTICT